MDKQAGSEYDAIIFEEYKRKFDQPRPRFESVPLDEFPSKWYETLGYFMLVILFNCVTFGFMCLMLLIRYAMGTELFVRVTVGVGFGLVALIIMGMYFGGLSRKRAEREMFEQSNNDTNSAAGEDSRQVLVLQ